MDEISTQVKHQETEEILKAAKPDQHYFMRNMDKVDHSEKLREGIQDARTTMIMRFHSSERKLDSLTYKPHHSLLVSAFQERNLNITAQKRQEDTRKKGSLLYNNLKNAALIKKAEKDLELLTRQVEVFDRLSKENGYLETLDERTRAEVEKKISQLRSIACYYQARKDVMLDSYYQSHLNEELTADITKLQGKEPKGDKEMK